MYAFAPEKTPGPVGRKVCLAILCVLCEAIKMADLLRAESGCGYSVKLALVVLSGPEVGIAVVRSE